MLAEIATGVLVNVITATGRWIATSAIAHGGGKGARRDADIAVWFGTYELAGTAVPELPDAAAGWLRRNDVHAVLHELLATRITDAPEADVERLRGAFRETARAALRPGPEPGALGGADRRGRRLARDEPGLPDVDPDALADRVFDWADGEVCELVARFEARDPQRWRAARQDAFGARVVAVLNAIDRHLTALDGRPDPKSDAEWAARYRRQAVRAYGDIEPPDFARRRKVPIDDLYVPPDIIEPGAVRDADGNPRTIGFDDLTARVDRTVLLGDPGGGKSTASRVLTHRWASDFAERVPFLVVLRDFGGAKSVVEHIEDRLNAFHQCAAPPGTVERLLLSGDAAVIFDGLDELIDTARRVEVTQVVEQFCERFPLAPVLVTSRIVGYDEARLDDALFDAYRIAGFTRDETAAYVRNWFAQEDDTDAEAVADAFMRESEQVTDLRANPLMLSLMCILYRGEGSLPRNRPGVYAECARLLFDKWDTRRGIHVDLQARNLIEPALRHIAYWLFTRDGPPEVTERELVAQATDLLYERGFEQRHDAEAAAEEFVRFCRGRAWILGDAGTTARGEALYTFTHRTFLEYFTAAYLASVHDTPEKLARALAPYVARGEWDVVGQLAVQIKDAATDRGAEKVLTALLKDKRRKSPEAQTHLVAFAARCLDVAEVPPALVRDITNRAFDQFDEHQNRALTYLPLWRDRVGEIVAEVLAERVAALLAAADPAGRRLGGQFAVYATFCAARNTSSAYWHRLEKRLTADNRDVLLELARTDDAIWMRLIDRGVLPLSEALRLRGDGLTVLFRVIRVPFTGTAWEPYVKQAIHEFADLDFGASFLRPDPDAGVSRLGAFAAALGELPEPPWAAGLDPVSRRVYGHMIGDFFNVPDPGTAGFAAAAVLLALYAEAQAAAEEDMGIDPSFWTRQDDADRLVNQADTEPGDARVRTWLVRRSADEIHFVQWRHGDEPE